MPRKKKTPPTPPTIFNDRNGRVLELDSASGLLTIRFPNGGLIKEFVESTDLMLSDGKFRELKSLAPGGYFFVTIGNVPRVYPIPNGMASDFLALYKAPDGLLCPKVTP